MENQSIWEGFDVVCFDVNSTLSAIEDMDELAKMKGKLSEIEELTKAAREGEILLEQAFEKRLDIIQPTLEDYIEVGRRYIHNVVEDAVDMIKVLKFLGKQIVLISAGHHLSVVTFAEYLGIFDGAIKTNTILFDPRGEYTNFDRDSSLYKSGGKIKIVKNLRQNGERIMFVGDGVSDLETKDTADLFVGYGGVAVRQKVLDEAEIFIKCRSLAPIALLAAGKKHAHQLLISPHRTIIEKALRLIKSNDVIIRNPLYNFQ